MEVIFDFDIIIKMIVTVVLVVVIIADFLFVVTSTWAWVDDWVFEGHENLQMFGVAQGIVSMIAMIIAIILCLFYWILIETGAMVIRWNLNEII